MSALQAKQNTASNMALIICNQSHCKKRQLTLKFGGGGGYLLYKFLLSKSLIISGSCTFCKWPSSSFNCFSEGSYVPSSLLISLNLRTPESCEGSLCLVVIYSVLEGVQLPPPHPGDNKPSSDPFLIIKHNSASLHSFHLRPSTASWCLDVIVCVCEKESTMQMQSSNQNVQLLHSSAILFFFFIRLTTSLLILNKL